MKALEILIECLENEKDIMKGYENLSNIDYIQEAIAELEALQAPKTCEGCVWVNTKTYLTQAYCVKCIRNDYMEDRYEQKDNA